ncbi:PIR protein [Plasmodium vivax]|uniref:VIR protein n=1 Tax=Plasmodium vivax TaxID=5855 RepID=A0A564ZXS3_PLAVI|nr:PIR protein [Plasmodium vivax]
MEFSQLKKYQFLGEILRLYETLDKPVDEKDPYQDVLKLCDNVSSLSSDFTGEHKNFCKKLSRNLLLIADGNYTGDKFMKYCDILYMWMYFELKKNRISNEITQKIFDQSTEIINPKRRKSPCSYFNFNEKHREPTKLMKLRIFNYNVDTFQGMLKGEINPNVCSLIRYIYKCIVIYRDMNSRYCSRRDDTTEENRNSCDILRQFNNLYTLYILKWEGISHKFPELSSNNPLNVIDGCSLEESKSDSYSNERQLGTPITKGVSTALGAMAGIPPFLALIYKFTPFGKLIRSRYNKGIANDIGENELYYPTTENMNNSSDHTRYNVLYGSVRN